MLGQNSPYTEHFKDPPGLTFSLLPQCGRLVIVSFSLRHENVLQDPYGTVVKNLPVNAGDMGSTQLVATHSSILAWEIPWTEEPGGLQSTGSQKIWTRFSY